MKRWPSLLLAIATLFPVLPVAAQVVRQAAPVAPAVPVVAAAPTGAYLSALTLQIKALTASAAPLPQAFAATVAPAPIAATPEAFAARAALVQALAAPKTALPALAASMRETDRKKGEAAASALEALGKTISAAPASEQRDLAKQAAKLNARFDGASAAPGEAVDLSALPTNEDGDGPKAARRAMKEDRKELRELQAALAASKDRAVLVVLQGMDAAGKDGVIKRSLMLNPAWTQVSAFKKPTVEEARQDFLERIKARLPEKGIIGVFNRSHYEDILVPTVYKTFSKEEIESRYRRINEFERDLTARGVLIVKIFLHESKDEQKARLQERLDNPEKRWKFSPADLEARKHWDAFQKAYAEVLARTSTPWAPWRVVAADDKPRRDAAVARLLRKALSRLGLQPPQAADTRGAAIPD